MVDFADGAVIFKEGDPVGPLYLVDAGSVEISKATPDGATVLGLVAPGGIFGEMALVDSTSRMATATAVGQTSCSPTSPAQMLRKIQLLGPVPLTFYNQMILYIRETLPWEARPPLVRAQGPSAADRAAREMLRRLPEVIASIDHPPPVIVTVFNMFGDYIQRRLPPG